MAGRQLSGALEHLAALCERQAEMPGAVHVAAMQAFNAVSGLASNTAMPAATFADLPVPSLLRATVLQLDLATSDASDLSELATLVEARTMLAESCTRT